MEMVLAPLICASEIGSPLAKVAPNLVALSEVGVIEITEQSTGDSDTAKSKNTLKPTRPSGGIASASQHVSEISRSPISLAKWVLA